MHTDRRRFVTGALALGATLAHANDAYPNRPVRLIVPYAPEGATGVFARLLTEVMGKILGQPFVADFRPGGAAVSAAAAVAHAAPDGYTMLLGDISTYVLNKSLYRDLPYDPQKDFAPITLTGRFALVLLVNTKKISAKSQAELIDMARRAPETIDFASPGLGTLSHLATELFAQTAGIKLNHVSYPSTARALDGLAGGQVAMVFTDFVDARAHLTTPGIKALTIASNSTDEYQALRGVPTAAAAGLPGFEAWLWQGLTVPAGTDADIIEKLRSAYVEFIRNPQIINRLAGAGFDVLQSTPAEFADYMRSETEKWDKVVRTANIKTDYSASR